MTISWKRGELWITEFQKKGREKKDGWSNFITHTWDSISPEIFFPFMFTLYFVNCKKGIKNDDITTH